MSDVVDSDTDGPDADQPADGTDAATATTVLTYVVKALVDDPDAVHVELDDRGRRPTLNVHVGAGDMGRVIGKRGRVAQSIRTVVRAAAVRDDLEIDIEFLD